MKRGKISRIPDRYHPHHPLFLMTLNPYWDKPEKVKGFLEQHSFAVCGWLRINLRKIYNTSKPTHSWF
jgi:hypothetical protein